jgi:hypothetical protein
MGQQQEQQKKALKLQKANSINFGLTLLNTVELTPALASQTTQLSKIKKDQGEKVLHALFTKLLIELSQFTEIKAPEGVLIKWAYKLMQKYWYFKASEIVLTLEMGVNGDFGKRYGALNYDNLIEWFNAYEELKTGKSVEKATQYREHTDANERSSLQGIKELLGKADFNEKYN